MVALVEQMLALHKRRAAARTPHEQTVFQAQIDATDHRIGVSSQSLMKRKRSSRLVTVDGSGSSFPAMWT